RPGRTPTPQVAGALRRMLASVRVRNTLGAPGIYYDCYGRLVSARSGEGVVTMRTISHRELRNNSSEILRDVLAGEIIEVTNHGEVSAVLVPPSFTPYERLLAAGKVRLPAGNSIDLRRIPRVRSSLRTTDIIADVRGDR